MPMMNVGTLPEGGGVIIREMPCVAVIVTLLTPTDSTAGIISFKIPMINAN